MAMTWDRVMPRLNPIQFRDDVLTALREGGWPEALHSAKECKERFGEYLVSHYFREDENLTPDGRLKLDYPNSEYIRSASGRMMIWVLTWDTPDEGASAEYRAEFVGFDPFFLEAAALVEWSPDAAEFGGRIVEIALERKREAERIARFFDS